MTEIQYQDPKALVDIKIKNRWFPNCHISWGIKIEDLWVGAFWKEETRPCYYSSMPEHWRHVWICLLPCLPIHISWRRREIKGFYWASKPKFIGKIDTDYLKAKSDAMSYWKEKK